MIEQERQLQVNRAEEERQRRVDRVGQDLLSRLERIKSNLLIVPAKDVPEAVVWVGRVRDGRLLLPWDFNPSPQQFRQWTEGRPFSDLMRRAQHEEIITGKVDDAVRLYREAIAGTPQPAVRAFARLSLARVLRRMSKIEECYQEYNQVLNSPPDLVDEHGIPLALYAAPPLLDAGKQKSEALELITRLLNDGGGLPPAALYLLRDLATKLGAAGAIDEITHQIQDREQAEARKTYERLVQNYSDQSDVAADARQRLASLGLSSTAPGSSGLTIRKVWAGRQGETPGVSPDGKYLVLTTVDTSAGDIVVQDLVTGEKRQVTHDGDPPKQGVDQGTISPDGKLIAYLLEVWGGSSQPNQSHVELRVTG